MAHPVKKANSENGDCSKIKYSEEFEEQLKQLCN